jgi:hypothetical protein
MKSYHFHFLFQMRFVAVLSLAVCAVLVPSRARADVYDAVADFSTNSNPNGVWSYGWCTNVGGQFQLMTANEVSTGLFGWWNGLATPNATSVWGDLTPSEITYNGVIFDPDTLLIDPQSDAVVVRFTAPTNGTFQIQGLFRLQIASMNPNPHNLNIQINNTNTAYYFNTGNGLNGTEYPFSFTCSLNYGDTLDFIATCSGNYVALCTGLKATITLSTNVLNTSQFDVVADFSTTANPNGVWSYVLWSNTIFNGTAQLLTTNFYPVVGQTNLFCWWNDGSLAEGTSVAVGVDDSSIPYSETMFPNVIYYPDTLLEDPEGLAVATRFTAPQSGVYSIQGFFRVQDVNLQSSGYAAILEVITNLNAGSPEFSVNSYGASVDTQYPFGFTNFLSQGATVDFADVGVGGDVHCLSSGLNVVIKLLSPLLLNIVPLDNAVLLTWPTNAAGFTLQSTTNLSSAVWSTNLPAPVVVNGQFTVTNPISGTQQFFRLSNP